MKNKQNFKLFIISDDLPSLSIYKQHLDNLGYKDVMTFSGITQCLAKLGEHPQLILVDHNIDTLTGLILLKMIRQANPDVHVVFVSEQKDIKTAFSLVRYGALDFIVKDEHELENIRKLLTTIADVKAA
jgi:DNA-binding NtrC family response regulator